MNRIREIRKVKKISGPELAEKLDITPQYLYGFEKGTRTLSADMASKIAKIFGVTVDYLLGDTNEPNGVTLHKKDGSEEEVNCKKSSTTYPNEEELISNINLSDEELLRQFKFTVDGQELSEKEIKRILALVRLERQLGS